MKRPSKPLPIITESELWAEVDKLVNESRLVNRPAGSFTAREYAAHRNWRPAAALKSLRKIADQGKLKSAMISQKRGGRERVFWKA